jgi:N-acetylmuramoyl-L-alanine amidase
MNAPLKDIKKLAQVFLKIKGFYSGEIDGIWGKGSNAAYTGYVDFLKAKGLEIGDDESETEDGIVKGIAGVVVLDPGHGGTQKIGGSSPNNATSASGVLEKTMTLQLAKLVSDELKAISKRTPESNIAVHMTRTTDTNLGLADRALIASAKRADVFLSIHYNGFNGQARGTETWILSEGNGNVNAAEDRALAERVQKGMLTALRRHAPGARDRGVKDTQKLGVLKDLHLGNSRTDHPTRACLLEVEFIDVAAVDELLNTGPNAKVVRSDVARAIAEAIVEDLRAHA